MNDQRNPITCPVCGTVNPWTNERCRKCDALLSELQGQDSTKRLAGAGIGEANSGDDKPASQNTRNIGMNEGTSYISEEIRLSEKKRWNVLWMIIGAFVYVGVMTFGDFAIHKWIIAPDKELKTMYEKITQKSPQEIQESEQKELLNLLLGNATFVVSVLALMVLAPFAVGGIVGYFSGGILEGAAAMGLAIVLILLPSGQAMAGLLLGVLFAGIGAGGSFLGKRIRKKRKSVEASPGASG